MGLRVCLVTPFAWSQPHDVNDHVAGVARELRASAIRSPSSRRPTAPATSARAPRAPERPARRRRGGRPRASHLAPQHDGRARRRRANLALALAHGAFDVVHGFEPGAAEPLVPRAPRHARARRGDVLLAGSPLLSAGQGAARTAARPDRRAARHVRGDGGGGGRALPRRLHGDLAGRRPELFRPAKKQRRIVVELVPGEREAARKAIRSLDELDGWEVVLLRQSALAGKPYVPLRLRGRVHVRTQPSAEERAALLNEASEFVPAPGGSERLALEAAAAVRRQRSRATASPTSPAELDSALPPARGPAAGDPRRQRPAVRSRVDRGRPPHAHVVVARLQRPCRGAARRGRGDRPRRDRRHRPQRVRRRARGGRAGTRSPPDRHPRRGDEDEGPGRGDRPLPARGDPARPELRGHDRRRPGPGRPRLPPSPVRPPPRHPRSRDAASAPGGDRRARGLQRTAAQGDVQRRGAALRAEVQPPPGRRLGRARAARPRHRRRAHARVPDARGVPHQPAHRPRSSGGRSR